MASIASSGDGEPLEPLGNSKMFHIGWPPAYATGEPHPQSSPRAAPGRELIGLNLFGSRLQTEATRIFRETDLREFQ